MASFWENLLGGGSKLGGAYYLYDQLDKDKGQVGNEIDRITQGAMDLGGFTPWTISGGVGNVAGGPLSLIHI